MKLVNFASKRRYKVFFSKTKFYSADVEAESPEEAERKVLVPGFSGVFEDTYTDVDEIYLVTGADKLKPQDF